MGRYARALGGVVPVANPVMIVDGGQSNDNGQETAALPVGAPVYTAGWMTAKIDEYQSTRFIFESIGKVQTKHGVHPQLALDIIGAGRTPFIMSVGKNATAISPYFLSGTGATTFDAMLPRYITSLGVTSGTIFRPWIHGEQDSTGAGNANYASQLATMTARERALAATLGSFTIFYILVKVNSNFVADCPAFAVVNGQMDTYVAGDALSTVIDPSSINGADILSPHYNGASGIGYNKLATLISAQIISRL